MSYVKIQHRASNIEEAVIIQVEVSQLTSVTLSLPSQCSHNKQVNRAVTVAGIESMHRSESMGLHSLSLIELVPLSNTQPTKNKDQQCTSNMAPSLEKTNLLLGGTLIAIDTFHLEEIFHLDGNRSYTKKWICLSYPQGLSQHHYTKDYIFVLFFNFLLQYR